MINFIEFLTLFIPTMLLFMQTRDRRFNLQQFDAYFDFSKKCTEALLSHIESQDKAIGHLQAQLKELQNV